MKKAVIFAPFWRQVGHVGNNRVDRFVRWLTDDDFHVVIIRAGSVDGRLVTSWGTEITVRDPMGLYRDARSDGVKSPERKPNKVRRALAYWLFNPDPTVVWARAAARHPTVLKEAADASLILSSSPPESAHVGAWQLSRRLGIPHIVDMRDGWLDEPLKPLLRHSEFKRWQEGRLEARILRDASAILVTSDVWLELLNKRLPEITNKVFVLTNAYPLAMPEATIIGRNGHNTTLKLIHAGRFFGSRLTQSPDLILQPLLDGLKHHKIQGTVKLIGSLASDELEIIQHFAPSFAEQGWRIECPGRLPREEVLKLLHESDGLLLLSASYAAIPSKFFEYIPSGRPVLVVTERGSAVWRIADQLPQAYLVAPGTNEYKHNVDTFLNAAIRRENYGLCPIEFSEAWLAAVFRRVLTGVTNNQVNG